MGRWIVSNCSSTLCFEDLPPEVKQGSVSVIRCYLPLKQEASASTDPSRASARETWWICPCTTEHRVPSGAVCTPFQKGVDTTIAYTWLSLRVPLNMPSELAWPETLAYLPMRVFVIAKHLYEWNNRETEGQEKTRGMKRRINKVKEGMNSVEQHLHARGASAARPRIHSPGSLSSRAQTTSNPSNALLTMAALSRKNAVSSWATRSQYATGQRGMHSLPKPIQAC